MTNVQLKQIKFVDCEVQFDQFWSMGYISKIPLTKVHTFWESSQRGWTPKMNEQYRSLGFKKYLFVSSCIKMTMFSRDSALGTSTIVSSAYF